MRLEVMKKSELALQALRTMSATDGNLGGSDLADRLGTTRQFLPQVLAPLVRAGWVESIPGPGGGYRLAADVTRLTLLDLIETVEGPLDDGHCVLRGRRQECDESCALHDAWTEARDLLRSRLGAAPIGGA